MEQLGKGREKYFTMRKRHIQIDVNNATHPDLSCLLTLSGFFVFMLLAADNEGTIAETTPLLTAAQKKRQRQREASKRYYVNHPEVKTKKQVQAAERRAAKKTAKRRWDPPKRSKPGRRSEQRRSEPDIFNKADQALLPSGDNPQIAELQTDAEDVEDGNSHTSKFTAQHEYETVMENAASENSADYFEEASAGRLLEEANDDPDEFWRPEWAGLGTLRAADEVVAAETLASMAGLSAPQELKMPSDTREPEGEDEQAGGSLTIQGAEMTQCRSDGESTLDSSAPEIAVVIEDVSDTRPARVFRGYRYEPVGPQPDNAARQARSMPSASPGQGICGDCRKVDACNTAGDDSEGLCFRCLDCVMGDYACWEHFNGVKDWEDPLW
ncbi:hypothetical protein B0H17DRAFT_1150905 [Mycena rosella]|uniref:Uncharacterized protein n=1 Tax=Mycena rosella TaxID=1033263 RepID=A0AAD7BPD1_MYCRO|nr:hypothetical protein B0H17DRAFT_1150905 [Mycena rosella]